MNARVIRHPGVPSNLTALALTAGGARGAHQSGVLKRIGEIAALRGAPAPFDIIAGASAGAINGAAIAAIIKVVPKEFHADPVHLMPSSSKATEKAVR